MLKEFKGHVGEYFLRSWGKKRITKYSSDIRKQVRWPVEKVVGKVRGKRPLPDACSLTAATLLLLTHTCGFLLLAAGMGGEDVHCTRTLGHLLFQLLRSSQKMTAELIDMSAVDSTRKPDE